MIDSNRIAEISKTFQRMRQKENDKFIPQLNAEKISILVGYYDGKYTVAVAGENMPSEIVSTNLISVDFLDYPNSEGLIFSLLEEGLLEIFVSFVFDLESLAKEDNSISLIDIYNRYRFWQKMFKTVKTDVSEPVLKGILNELYILEKYFIPKYGIYEATKGWIGSDRSHKDFTFSDGTWYETKSINVGKNTVQISSLEQLESDISGYLVVSELEKTSPNNLDSLNLYKVFRLIKTKVEEESILGEIYNKIVGLGIDITALTDEKHPINNNRYIIKEVTFYRVDKDFPRISKKELPDAVSNVSYDLLLSELVKFRSDKIEE